METANLALLSNHFSYKEIEIKSKKDFFEQVKFLYPENYLDFQYGVCLVENSTEKILDICYLTNKKFSYNNALSFYLKQLKNLELNSVALMLVLCSNNQSKLFENIYEFPENYPSEFAKAYLKSTYGKIIFNSQFIDLLSFCLPQNETQLLQLNEYKRLYNLRDANFFKKLENIFLPDGYSLYQLLKNFTPFYSSDDDFGFVTFPNHKSAYLFMESAKKYLSQ